MDRQCYGASAGVKMAENVAAGGPVVDAVVDAVVEWRGYGPEPEHERGLELEPVLEQGIVPKHGGEGQSLKQHWRNY